MNVEEQAATVEAVFREIHARVFRGDLASNPRLRVEVVGAALAGDTPAMVLVTPWTLNGLAFPPDGEFPPTLPLVGKGYPVFASTVDGIGTFRSVVLLGDVSALDSPAQARELAQAMVGPFCEAVAAVRAPAGAAVANPERRRLLTGFRD